MQEIERKFLVDTEMIKFSDASVILSIKQGYLLNTIDKVVRVRIQDCYAFITIKIGDNALSRQEFEYEIPFLDGLELIKQCPNPLTKERNIFYVNGKKWEVDVFTDVNQGLVIAEIELESENEEIQLPIWVEEEVTQDPKYLNSNLIIKPFSQW